MDAQVTTVTHNKEITMTVAFFAYIRTIQESMRPEFKRISTPEVWYCLDRITDLD